MREITADEVFKLRECLEALAVYHNEVSHNFKGFYPNRQHDVTLDMFAEALRSQSSRIAVAEGGQRVLGFCKVDVANRRGKIDYLVVLPEFRRKGYGRALMDWAMAVLRQQNAEQIEVKVVDGNDDAVLLYESYGFRVNAKILLRRM